MILGSWSKSLIRFGAAIEYEVLGNGYVGVVVFLGPGQVKLRGRVPRPKGWSRYRSQTFEQYCRAEDRKERKAKRRAA